MQGNLEFRKGIWSRWHKIRKFWWAEQGYRGVQRAKLREAHTKR